MLCPTLCAVLPVNVCDPQNNLVIKVLLAMT